MYDVCMYVCTYVCMMSVCNVCMFICVCNVVDDYPLTVHNAWAELW